MKNFLENLLLSSKFSTVEKKPEFLPRKLGLGYQLEFKKINKDVLRPVFKEIRKSKIKEDLKKEESESEEMDRIKHIEKKMRKK